MAFVYSEDTSLTFDFVGVPNTMLFGVLWHSLSTVALGSSKTFSVENWMAFYCAFFCGTIVLLFFVGKLLGGYCFTFTYIGLHIYALSIFGIFGEMSVLLCITFLCVHMFLFSNMSFLPSSGKYMKMSGSMSKNRTQDFGVLILQQYKLLQYENLKS